MSSVSKVVRIHNAPDKAVLAEAKLDSFNPTNFTLDWTVADGNAWKFHWVICGSE